MNTFFRSREFWISTIIFLIVVGGIGYFIFPRLVSDYQDQRHQMADLNNQIASQTQYIATIKSLTAHPDTIDSLYTSASELLPTTLKSDLLALQLDGLLASLNLTGITVTVPFTATGTTAPSVTLTGPATFNQAEQLIAGLKTLGRWNKINSIEINQSANQPTVTIMTNVFSRSTTPPEFTGSNTKLLVQAALLFKSYQSYTTVPNVSQEGQYGRPDPFATP